MALRAPVPPPDEHREDLLQLLVETVRDYAIFMLDPSGYVTTWNPGAARMKGYTADEIIGKHFSVFYPAEDLAAGKPDWELLTAAREGRFEDEGWRLRKDGSRFWANVVITAVRNRDGVLLGFGKVTRDLTARRQAEETARQLIAEQSARAVAEKDESFQRHMLAIVGHDLRNCLSVILTAGEMVRLHADDPSKVRHRAEQVVNSARRMTRIVRIIVDYTQAQRVGGIPIFPREGTDFHGICGRVLDEFRVLHPQRRVVYEADGSPLGEWDEGRLEQVVQNLVGNAIRYSPPGSQVALRWRRQGSDSDPGDLMLAVHNDGPPIPPELLPHVFEPFRSGVQSADASDSMGLGLFIVREIVRAHGGEVRVESDAEHGTTFAVTLPPSPPRRAA